MMLHESMRFPMGFDGICLSFFPQFHGSSLMFWQLSGGWD